MPEQREGGNKMNCNYEGANCKFCDIECKAPVTEIYAWRSRHGMTINKCVAIREGKIKPGKRTPEEIRAEIKKVEKAKADAYKKFCRADDRLEELYGELEVTEK